MNGLTPAPASVQARRALRILAIDLGKFTSVACDYDTTNQAHAFTTVKTNPAVLHDLIVEREPGRVVSEIGSAAPGIGLGARPVRGAWC